VAIKIEVESYDNSAYEAALDQYQLDLSVEQNPEAWGATSSFSAGSPPSRSEYTSEKIVTVRKEMKIIFEKQ
jgi:hypothetical protein